MLWRARQQSQPSRKGDGAEEGLPADSSARSSRERKQQGWGKLNKGCEGRTALDKETGLGCLGPGGRERSPSAR